MSTVSRDIRLNVTAEVKDYVREMASIPGTTQKQAAAAGRQLARELARAERVAVESAKKAAASTTSAWSQVGTAIAAVVSHQVVSAVRDTVSEVQGVRLELAELSTRTALNTDTLAGFRQALAASGNELNNIEGALTDFPKRMLDASNGTGEAVSTFEALDIAVTDANGSLRDSDSVMRETIRKIQQMDNRTEQAAAATAIFGESGTRLMEALSGGELEAFIAQAETWGVDVSPAAIQGAKDWQSATSELQLVIQGLKGDIVDTFVSTSKLEGFTTGLVAAYTFLVEIVKDASVELLTLSGNFVEFMSFGRSSAEGVRAWRDAYYEANGTVADRVSAATTRLIEQREATDQVTVSAGRARPALAGQATATREAADAANELARANDRMWDIGYELLDVITEARSDTLTTEQEISQQYREQLRDIALLAQEAERLGVGDQETIARTAAEARRAIEYRLQRDIAEAERERIKETREEEQKAQEARVAEVLAQGSFIMGLAGQASQLYAQLAEKSKAGARAAFRANQVVTVGNIAMNTAEAITKAIAMFGPPPSPVGIAAIGTAVGIGGVQAGLALAQKPPEFAGGGVVPGSAPMAYGDGRDERHITARPGEVVFTPEQLDALRSRGGAPQTAVNVYYDKRIMGRYVQDDIRGGGPIGRAMRPTGLMHFSDLARA